MQSIEILNNTCSDLSRSGAISTLEDVKLLKEKTILDKILDEQKIYETLNNEVGLLLEMMLDETYEHYYDKTLRIEKLLTPFLNEVSEYMLCLYCNDEEAFNNFPRLLKAIIDKCEISLFTSLSLNDIKALVYKYISVEDKVIDNKVACKLNFDKPLETDLYNKYDDKIEMGCRPSDPDWFRIWAEYKTYNFEKRQSTVWISRYYGKNRGFDILSYEPNSGIERLSKVITSFDEKFILTKKDVEVMKNCILKKGEYLVYKYTYNIKDNKLYTTILKYDDESNTLRNASKIFKIEKHEDEYLAVISNEKVNTLKR